MDEITEYRIKTAVIVAATSPILRVCERIILAELGEYVRKKQKCKKKELKKQ